MIFFFGSFPKEGCVLGLLTCDLLIYCNFIFSFRDIEDQNRLYIEGFLSYIKGCSLLSLNRYEDTKSRFLVIETSEQAPPGHGSD